MFVIFFFTAVCLAISFTKERPFTLSGATVGFDNRGTPIAGKTLALEHFPKAECTGELSLKADGSFSQYVIIGDWLIMFALLLLYTVVALGSPTFSSIMLYNNTYLSY